MDKDKQNQLKEFLASVEKMDVANRDQFIARTISEVYDEELNQTDLVSAVSRFETAEPGEHLYYLSPATVEKKVFVLTTNCQVTEEELTPNTRTEMTWTNLVSPEFYICINDWIEGDHNVLALFANSINEAMNRQENYSVLQLLDACATSSGNLFTLDSGKTAFDYPKAVEMVRVMAKYGQKLVLVTGSDITTDIMLDDYETDKNRTHSIPALFDQWIRLEDHEVTIGGVATQVMPSNVAFVVAVEDSAGEKPIIFARRKTNIVSALNHGEKVAKERVIFTGATPQTLGSTPDRLLSTSVIGYESYSAVCKNALVVAKFTA